MADFLEKLKKGVNDGAAIASIKSKNLIEITKLKNQISTLEGKKKDQIEELGAHYYRGYRSESLGTAEVRITIKTVCEAIASIDASVREKEETIKIIQQEEEAMVNSMKTITCQCGEIIKPGTLFCKRCGTKVESMAAPQTESQSAVISAEVRCDCGKPIKENMRFCGGCGKNLADQITATALKEENTHATE